MSNAIIVPDSAPDYLKSLLSNPDVVAANAAFTGGITPGMHPMIGTSGTRFLKKEGGEEAIIEVNGAPITVLNCVVLSAKPNLDKKYYATAYDPNVTSEPDCQSSDGIRPDAGCPTPMHETCAGCPMNVFGTGVDAKGQATKGKACSDVKKIAIFAAGKIYGFNIPPASLKGWNTYVKDLTGRGIPLQGVITAIGFDIETPQILTFKYAGALAPDKVPAVVDLIKSKEVTEIVTFKLDATKALPAAAGAATQKEIPQETAAAQPATTATIGKATPSRAAKKNPPAAAQQAAEPANDPLGLGGGTTAAQPAVEQAGDPLGLDGNDAAGSGANLDDAQINNLLGL